MFQWIHSARARLKQVPGFRSKWKTAASFWGHRHNQPQEQYAFWLADEEVMQWVNVKVSGNPSIWPLSWFLLSLPENVVPVRRAVSIGCGPGNLEREVIRHGAARYTTGIDISTRSLDLARRLTEESGYTDRISYALSDGTAWLRTDCREEAIDLIFFHASLHHIDDLETILQLCADRLRGGNPGILYVDEYIGPSRDEWTPGHLGYAAALFEKVPVEYRQSHTLTPPVAFEDPTEMIRSSSIPKILRSHFRILEYKPYFGNVVMPLVSGIRPNGLHNPQVRALIREAMQLEDYLTAKRIIEPMHAVFVTQPL